MKKYLFISFLLMAIIASPLYATPLYYTNESDFQTAASGSGIVLSSPESFESGSLPTFGNVSISGVDFLGLINNTDYATAGSISVGWRAPVNDPLSGYIRFTFSSPINAFGIDIVDLGTEGATTLSVAIGSNSPEILFDGVTGARYNQRFGGVIDTINPFTSVEFTNTAAGDAISFDRLQTGTSGVIPEPTTMLLFGSGLIGLAGFKRRLRNNR